MSIQFKTYEDSYRRYKRVSRKSPSLDDFYKFKTARTDAFSEIATSLSMNASLAKVQTQWEYRWCTDGRPYYNLYPGMLEMLLTLDISKVRLSQLKPPSGLKALIVNLPLGNKFMDDGSDAYHIMITVNLLHSIQHGGDDIFGFGLNYGEEMAGEPGWDVQFATPKSVKRDGSTTVEDVCSFVHAKSDVVDCGIGRDITKSATVKTAKLAAAICLIGEDSSFLVPEILSRDLQRAEERRISLHDLQARAKARGKFGWSLGKNIEKMPHTRRPHPALYWTGVGRQTPTIVIREGSVVHRKVVESIPTGYHDEDVPKE